LVVVVAAADDEGSGKGGAGAKAGGASSSGAKKSEEKGGGCGESAEEGVEAVRIAVEVVEIVEVEVVLAAGRLRSRSRGVGGKGVTTDEPCVREACGRDNVRPGQMPVAAGEGAASG